jgi:hypothetical protein
VCSVSVASHVFYFLKHIFCHEYYLISYFN